MTALSRLRLGTPALAALCCVLVPAAAPAAPRGVRGSVVRIEHRDPVTAPTRGPLDAPVQIELFFVPRTNLGAAVSGLRALERLQDKHPTRIRLVYRILKGSQPMLSIAVLEAQAQGKFADLIDVLHTDRSPQLPKKKILALAREAGMNEQRLIAALSEGRYDDVFDANDRRLKRLAHGNSSMTVALFNARLPARGITSPNANELEREYQAAYDRAEDLLDRGVPIGKLQQAFELQALRPEQPFIATGARDDFIDDDLAATHPLADPPLSLAGMPTFGKARDALPVVLLCQPDRVNCHSLMRDLRSQQSVYADDIRIVWAPFFDVTRQSRAADLALLGDAALCAEQVGSSPNDFDASPGWVWVNKVLETYHSQHSRRLPAERIIDQVAHDLEINLAELSECRARIANSTLDWVERARKSGVERAPAIVIGGRIYEGLTEPRQIQQLIEAELAPGVLARCATIGCATPTHD